MEGKRRIDTSEEQSVMRKRMRDQAASQHEERCLSAKIRSTECESADTMSAAAWALLLIALPSSLASMILSCVAEVYVGIFYSAIGFVICVPAALVLKAVARHWRESRCCDRREER